MLTTFAELLEVYIRAILSFSNGVLGKIVVLSPCGIVSIEAVGNENERYIVVARDVRLHDCRGRHFRLVLVPHSCYAHTHLCRVVQIGRNVIVTAQRSLACAVVRVEALAFPVHNAERCAARSKVVELDILTGSHWVGAGIVAVDGHSDEAVAQSLGQILHAYDAARTPSATCSRHFLDKNALHKLLEHGGTGARSRCGDCLILHPIDLRHGQFDGVSAQCGGRRQLDRQRDGLRASLLVGRNRDVIGARCLVVHGNRVVEIGEFGTQIAESHIHFLPLSECHTVRSEVAGSDSVVQYLVGLDD